MIFSLVSLGESWSQPVNKTFQNDSWQLDPPQKKSWHLTALDTNCLAENQNSQDQQANYFSCKTSFPYDGKIVFSFSWLRKNHGGPLNNSDKCCHYLPFCAIFLFFFCSFSPLCFRLLLPVAAALTCPSKVDQLWQEKVCQATRLFRAKTHLARCVTSTSCASFPNCGYAHARKKRITLLRVIPTPHHDTSK